jgi:hypothetical protein
MDERFQRNPRHTAGSRRNQLGVVECSVSYSTWLASEVLGSRNLSDAQLSLLSSAPLDYVITRRQSPNFRSAPRI